MQSKSRDLEERIRQYPYRTLFENYPCEYDKESTDEKPMVCASCGLCPLCFAIVQCAFGWVGQRFGHLPRPRIRRFVECAESRVLCTSAA